MRKVAPIVFFTWVGAPRLRLRRRLGAPPWTGKLAQKTWPLPLDLHYPPPTSMKPAVVQTARYLALVMLVLAVGVLLVAQGMRYLPEASEMPTEVRRLPLYALYSFTRMLVAYVGALIFSVTYGYFAATSRRAERVLM